jgi:hypothetical protein
MKPDDRWRDVVAARIPLEHLAALAPVRNRDGIRVDTLGDVAWVRWPAGTPEVVKCVLPVPGCVLFTQHRGVWFRFGSKLPSSDVPPEGDGLPVAAVLVPARFEVIAPPTEAVVPAVIGIIRGGEPKAASALVCTLAELLTWAEAATTHELAGVRAARCGDRVVLLSSRLPSIPGAVRFWGTDVLVPVGFRPEPELPPMVLRAACGIEPEELLLLDESGVEAIPRVAFEPLTRAGVRLGVAQP